jgi:hypothetical protein
VTDADYGQKAGVDPTHGQSYVGVVGSILPRMGRRMNADEIPSFPQILLQPLFDLAHDPVGAPRELLGKIFGQS